MNIISEETVTRPEDVPTQMSEKGRVPETTDTPDIIQAVIQRVRRESGSVNGGSAELSKYGIL